MSHFRSSTLTVDQTSLMGFTFSGQQSFRASYPYTGPGVAVGNVISNSDILYFGDGSFMQIWLKVLAINSTDDYFVAQIVDSAGNAIAHTYASVGSYEAYFESGARITTNDTFSNNNYRAEVIANPGILNEAPVSSVPPIVQVADNSIFTYQIAAFDPDGQPLTYRIGNASEFISSGSSDTIMVAPAGVTVSSTGLLTWDVRDVGGAAVADGQKFTMTAMVSDGLTKTPIDFILQIVSTTNNQAPSFTLVPPTQNLTIGQSVSVALVATDPNANLTTITALNPPVGMITDYHAGHSELHVGFTATTGGTYVVTFQATDAGGLTAQTSVTFNVAANAAPDAVDDTLSGGGSGAIRVAVIGALSSDVAGTVGQLNDDTHFDFTATGYTVASLSTKAAWDLVLSGYDVVVVGGSGYGADGGSGAPVFASLADFAALGGGVVSTSWYQHMMMAVDGTTQAYMDAISPLTPTYGGYVDQPYVITITGAAHPATAGISQITTGAHYWETTTTLDPSAVSLATATNGQSAAAYAITASDAHLLFLGGLYLGNQSTYNTGALRSGDADRLLEQGVAWARGASSFSEDEVAQIDQARLLENDSDPDGDTLVISAVSATSAQGGAVTLNGDGTIGYDPRTALNRLTEGEAVEDSFTYTIDDGHGGTDTATVRFTVTGVNDAATIGGTATGDVVEDGTQTATGTLTIVDPDSGQAELQPIAAGTAGANGYGTFAVAANGQWTYTLDNADPAVQALPANGKLTDTTLVTSEDGSDTQTITITITGANEVPVAVGDLYAGFEDQLLLVAAPGVLANDSDANADSLSAILVDGPDHALSFTLNPDGSFSYQAASDFAGSDSFSYKANDGRQDSNVVTVALKIGETNDAPVGIDGAVSTPEDTAYTFAVANFFYADEENDPLASVTINTLPATGTLLLNNVAVTAGQVIAAADIAAGLLAYQPVANGNGHPEATFTFTLRDAGGTANGGVDTDSAPNVMTINVAPVNDAPNSVADVYNVVEDTLLTVPGPGVLSNDGDIDGDAITAELVSGPGNALSFSFNADGSFTYQANANYSGADSFSYRAWDGFAWGNTVTVSLNVIAEDDAAIARNDTVHGTETTLLAGNVFADNGSGADSDPDSALAVFAVNGSTSAVGQQIALPSGALLTLNANGSFSYDPNGRFGTTTSAATGASNILAQDLFTYSLVGGGTATVIVDLDGVRTVDDLLIGSAGNDTITDLGYNYSDSFLLQQGGNDSATGLGGNDGFYFGAAMDGLDTVNGGSGTDSVAVQGNYPGLVLGNITNVEVFVPLAGNDTRFGDLAGNFYDYNVTTNDANVAAGQTLTVVGSMLRAGEDLTFNGAAETNGNFRMFAGQGTDTLTGGAGSDGFFFGADGNLTGLDRVNGGGGVDSLALRGNYVGAGAVVFQPLTMVGVETLVFLSGHTNEFGGFIDLNGFDYDVTLADGNLAGDQRLDVIGTGLKANESLRFDGRAETDGNFRILSGAGDDTLYGGFRGDTLYGGAGADVMDGGLEADTYVYRLANESTAASQDRIVWGVGDKIDLSQVDANANTGANDAFTFIGTAAFTGAAGQLRHVMVGPNAIVQGDVNGDGVADLQFQVDAHVPVVGDFIL